MNFFSRIFVELFVFVIDSQCGHLRGVVDPGVLITEDFLVLNAPESWLHWFTKKMQNTSGSGDFPPPPVTYTLGSFNSCVFLSPDGFFCKPVLILLPNIAKSRLQVYSPQGGWDSPDIFTTGKCRLPGIFTTGSQTPQYIHLRVVILDTEESFYQF